MRATSHDGRVAKTSQVSPLLAKRTMMTSHPEVARIGKPCASPARTGKDCGDAVVSAICGGRSGVLTRFGQQGPWKCNQQNDGSRDHDEADCAHRHVETPGQTLHGADDRGTRKRAQTSDAADHCDAPRRCGTRQVCGGDGPEHGYRPVEAGSRDSKHRQRQRQAMADLAQQHETNSRSDQ